MYSPTVDKTGYKMYESFRHKCLLRVQFYTLYRSIYQVTFIWRKSKINFQAPHYVMHNNAYIHILIHAHEIIYNYKLALLIGLHINSYTYTTTLQ